MTRIAAAAALALATVVSSSAAAAPSSASAAPSSAAAARPIASAALSSAAAARPAAVVGTSARPPVPRHVVVVIMENHSFAQIVGNRSAPFLNRLARTGRLLTHMHAVTHPSQPNYLDLFAGAAHGVLDDSCPHMVHADNLAHQLLAHGYGFAGYAEGLPHRGSKTCSAGEYLRRHAPWVNFANVPGRLSRPFSAFPRRFAALPTVSFVVPDALHDMHDGTIAQGDRWLDRHLSGYARWARTHDSWLVVTWDEDNGTLRNHIPTMITGAHVGRGHIARRLTLFSLLQLLERTYRLPLLHHARTAARIPLP